MTADDVELPGVLSEIEGAVGRPAAFMIMAEHGGTVQNFPAPMQLEMHPKAYTNNWLVKLVGMETALEIVRELFPAGGRVDIPSGSVRIGTEARRAYVEENAGLYSTREMAQYLGITERGIRYIKASLRREGKIA